MRQQAAGAATARGASGHCACLLTPPPPPSRRHAHAHAPAPPRCSCSEDTLRDYFAQFGALEAAEVMKDRYTGKSRGFGFVCFVDPACALRALNTEHTIDGRRCEAKVALPKVRVRPRARAHGGARAARWRLPRERAWRSTCEAWRVALRGRKQQCVEAGAWLVAETNATWLYSSPAFSLSPRQGDPTPPRTTRIFVARIPPSVTETQFRSYFESFGKLQVGACHARRPWGRSGRRGSETDSP